MFERHLLAFYNRFRHIHDDLALFDRTINLHEQFLIGSFLTFQGKHNSFVQEHILIFRPDNLTDCYLGERQILSIERLIPNLSIGIRIRVFQMAILSRTQIEISESKHITGFECISTIRFIRFLCINREKKER